MAKIRITKLRLVLSIAGAVWGVNGFFHVFMREGGPVDAIDVIIELPALYVEFIWNLIYNVWLDLPWPPYFLALFLELLLILLTALTGAVIGFLSAVNIENLASRFHRASS